MNEEIDIYADVDKIHNLQVSFGFKKVKLNYCMFMLCKIYVTCKTYVT